MHFFFFFLSLSSPIPGLTSRTFEGFPGVQEVQCTGEELKGDVGIFSMTLYAADNKRSLSSVNLVTKTCSASSVFASCFIDDSDTRKTRIRALITDLVEEEVREFGCNLTTFVGSSKQTTFVNWWLPVSRPSEYQLSINSVCRHKCLMASAWVDLGGTRCTYTEVMSAAPCWACFPYCFLPSVNPKACIQALSLSVHKRQSIVNKQLSRSLVFW